jgi:O-antigen/teichoic acid export membrane protein
LPAHLFSGLYRPRLVSQYAKTGSFEALNRQLIVILKISNYIIAGGIALFAVYGDAVLGWASQGKYADAYSLMLLFLLLMLVDNQRQILMVLCNVIEQVDVLSRSSLLMPLALPAAVILALAGLGSHGLALALIIAELLSIVVVLHLLERAGYHVKFGLSGQLRIAAAAILSILAGLAFHRLHPDTWLWNLAGMAVIGLFFVMLARSLGPISEDERASIERVIGRKIYVL